MEPINRKRCRSQPLPESGRLHETAAFSPPVEDADLYRIVDVLNETAAETGRGVPQIAIEWLADRPPVSSVIIGARDEHQLRQNLGALEEDRLPTISCASNGPAS